MAQQKASVALLALLLTTAALRAEDSFKLIHQPGGGQIVYGQIASETTLKGGMVSTLRRLHEQFGDRPQVTRFFRTKGSTDSVATFFTLTAKKQGNRAVAGLVLIAMPQGQPPTGAVLYDDANHFQTSMGPMMKKLNEVWGLHESKAASGGNGGGGKGGVGHAKPLHVTVFADNSGSIGLPEGWQITAAQQGVMHAAGPNNESVHIGVYVPVMDPTNPQQRQMIQMETQGGRMPLPGLYVAVPYGTEPFRLLQEVSRQLAAKQRKPAPTLDLIQAQDKGNGCTLFGVHLDLHDGKGRMYSDIFFCVMKPIMPGTYAVSVNQTVLPESLAEEEAPTLQAMFQSYKTNDQVINAETQTNINEIHEIGRRAQIQADASHAAWDIHQKAYYAQQDAQDRSFQAFDNYILDQSVIRDTQENAHGTFYNSDAEAIVKSNPNRYEYVPTQDFVKGIDY